MELRHNNFVVSDDKKKLQLDRVVELLHTTYWAETRSRETIEKSIENSLCFGIYDGKAQVGFCRCVTDYATFFWLADVIIDEQFRGLGLGRALMEAVSANNALQGLRAVLATEYAHGLYSKFGFVQTDDHFMTRYPTI